MWLRQIICIFIIMTILLSSFQIGTGQEDEEPIILRCAIEQIHNTNPLKEDEASWKVLSLIYEGATKYNPETGHLVPYIAVGSANGSVNTSNLTWEDCSVGNFGYSPKEVWKNSSKPEIIIFYDFENVLWHDDEQMTLRDIMFSFHAYAAFQYPWLGHPLSNEENYSITQWLNIYIVWEAEDNSRAALKFVLQKPHYSVFEDYLSSPILPYHIWGSKVGGQEVDGAKIWYDTNYSFSNRTSWQPSRSFAWLNEHPIGSGPFKWEGSEGDRMVLTTWRKHFYNQGYKYFAGASQPNIDGISFRFYEYDEDTKMDLENNELDLIAWSMPQADLNRFSNDPYLSVKYLKNAGNVEIIYNMRGRTFGYDESDPSGWDYGKPLRKALAHCIDADEIDSLTRFALEGEELGLFSEWQNNSSPLYAFDPHEAMNILERAGYLLENMSLPPGTSNHWLNPDGTPMGDSIDGTIELLVPEYVEDPLMFQIGSLLEYQIAEIGIDIKLVPLKIDELWDRVFAGDFQMSIVAQDYHTRSRVKFELSEDEDADMYRNPPIIKKPMPANGATNVTPYELTLSVFVSDPDGDPLTVTFYDAYDDSVIGVAEVDLYDGDTASVKWWHLSGYTTYSWYVSVDDKDFWIISPTYSFTTAATIGTRGAMANFGIGEGTPEIYLKRPENYYYSSFHSNNILAGPNFCGYSNSSFDRLIERAMLPIDKEVEKQYIQDAIATLDYDVPIDHLYYQYRYEVHRNDNFVGFIDDGSGSLLNLQSMINIKVPEKEMLVAKFMTIPSVAISNSYCGIKIRVLDQDGRGVEGALVQLGSSIGTLEGDSGLTNEQGIFTTSFIAPHIGSGNGSMNGTPVSVSIISVTKDRYRDAESRGSIMIIYPENTAQLSVYAITDMDMIQDRISADIAGYTYVDIIITDHNRLPINEATVTVELDGVEMIIDSSIGITDPQGVIRFKITATEVNKTEECMLTISAAKSGFIGDQTQVLLTVLPTDLVETELQAQDNSWFTILALVIFASLVSISYIWWRKGRKSDSSR